MMDAMSPVRRTPSHRRLVAAFVAVGVIVIAAVVGWRVYDAVVQPDAPSAFYTPPEPLPDGPPGTVIRSEPIAAPVAGERSWRVLYTSTDPTGEPIAVSGVIVAPAADAPDDGWPVLAWAHGTTGIASRCAPSLETGGGIGLVPDEQKLVHAGTVLAITDYPGLGTPGPHPYLAGESEGRAVLDSIRAARQLLGNDVNGAAAVFGHSQGGHATLFADQIGPSYAPDIELDGVAAMAPPTDLGALMVADAHEQLGIVLTALTLGSWSRFYPDADLDAVVHTPARPLVRGIATRCIENAAQSYTDLIDVLGLQVGFLSADPTTQPGWSQHITDNSLGDLPTDVPVLVAQGLQDDLVRPLVTESYVHDQCARGVAIEFDRYPDEDHFGVRAASADSVTSWLLDRLAGSPARSGCETVDEPPSSGS
jgi:hypothetical protein